ncbi:MAG TPA: DJ-1/PfpI family protein [Steroidobacteraceae bacterium]|nr:DJ-1/PfpI family protein [Steroidobacteraceae bacterium]
MKKAIDRSPVRAKPHRVAMLGFPQAQILDIVGPLEVFSRTARWLGEHCGTRTPAYAVEFVAARAGPVAMSNGLQLVATRRYQDLDAVDTLLVAGGLGWEAAIRDRKMMDWIAAQAARVGRLGSICNGALLLAAAGLLNGRAATTHWAYLDRLGALAPEARLDRDALYVRSGNIYTSAGVTAGMDLALALVEQDHGKATALAVAQELVLFLKRPGGQSQFSRHLQAQRRDDLFGELELWMLENPGEDLSVDRLARRMSMSPRHFARLFSERLGESPGAYARRMRVEQARRRIEEGATKLKQVARECGFADEQSLRRGFQAVVGITPAEYRQRF